ncbi:MAG: T9SS type A sorting domain-containing protein [Bacteroidetes bacterium]|nr:MAG: T9SS type A sorting domain-containing protein [Bacteroidota bacterium]
MKKVYLIAGALIGAMSVNAQKAINTVVSAKHDKTDVMPAKKKVANATKAEGDIFWQNGFDTPSEWSQTTGVGHTAGDWAIINTLPSNVTSQQAGYAWPATFSGASGNYAFINSDAAGGSASQDAYFEFNTNIDLSGAGSNSLYLTFAEYYRHYYDYNYVEVSNDGGTTWTEFAVNLVSEADGVTAVNFNCLDGEVETLNITPAMSGGAWTNQVRIRFHYVGQWDWFWGIDDVKIVQAWDNDVKINTWYQATPIATSFGLDYYHISASQSSFPGLTFGAIASNNGALDQSAVALHVTGTGGYDQTGSSVAIAGAASDTLSVETPYLPTGLGTKTVNITTEIGVTDADPANNTASFDMFLTQYEFSRDNNVQTSSIGQISSQDAQPLKIGNVMEIFNQTDITAVKLRLSTQAAGAVGGEFFCELYRWNGVDAYDWIAETEIRTVTGTAATWVQIPLVGGPVTVNAGDDILVVAGHFGGTDEVRFAMAQGTYEGTVLGYTAADELFSLTDPGAVMIRLIDDPSANVNELTNTFGMSVYPNPANDLSNVSFELNNEADVNITVTDLSGKVVYTNALGTVNGTQNVAINTTALNNGVYFVNLSVNGTVSSEKLVVRK